MNYNHYQKGAPEGKGGQFAPKNANNTGGSLSFIPKTTSAGTERFFFRDLPEETRLRIEQEYITKHAEFIRDTEYLYDNFKTSKIKTPERELLRNKILNDEFEDQMQKGPKRQEKKATILIGLPGSGKSTIANPLISEMGAFIIDADEFKKRIPEFQNDKRMVSAVHHESVDLADKFMDELSDNGYNMIIGKVGGDYESIKYILDNLQEKGYSLDIILNDVPFEVAVDRTIGRFDRGESDRFVPFWTLKTADKNIFSTFDKALNHPAITGGKIYSNDVPKGTKPVLLHEFKK